MNGHRVFGQKYLQLLIYVGIFVQCHLKLQTSSSIQRQAFSGEAFTFGVEQHSIDHTTVQIYSVEKTLADYFKFRNRIGMDTVREALTLYRERKKPNPRKLMQFAKICRVENVMRPYLEAQL